MRYTPAAAALSLLLMVQASVGLARADTPDPCAQALLDRGQIALTGGDPQAAIDDFEAALAVDPGYAPIYLQLARAARAEGLQGKAIGYYRDVLDRDPVNYAALAGEGEALVEKGAVAKAQVNLARLESLCGGDCAETKALAAVIDRGPAADRVMTAEAVLPEARESAQN